MKERINELLKSQENLKTIINIIRQERATPRFIVEHIDKPEPDEGGWYKNTMENLVAFSYVVCESDYLKDLENVPISSLVGPRHYIFEETSSNDHNALRVYASSPKIIFCETDKEKRKVVAENFFERCECGCGRVERAVGPLSLTTELFSKKNDFLRIHNYASFNGVVKQFVVLNRDPKCAERYYLDENIVRVRYGKEVLKGYLAASVEYRKWREGELLIFLENGRELGDVRTFLKENAKLVDLINKKVQEIEMSRQIQVHKFPPPFGRPPERGSRG